MPTAPETTALLARCAEALDAARAAGADDVEVIADASRSLTVGLQNNDLESLRSEEDLVFGLRVRVGARSGFATTNQPAELRALAAAAVALARQSPPEEGLRLPTFADALIDDDGVDPELDALLGPAGGGPLAARAVAWLQSARALDGRVVVDSGELSLGTTHRVMLSSGGGIRSWRGAEAGGSLVGMAVDGAEIGSFTWDADRVREARALDAALDGVARRFSAKCTAALGAGRGESFRGAILIPADCVSELLLDPLLELLSADRVRQGKSTLGERLGAQIAVPAFTLTEEGPGFGAFPLAPFDRDGAHRVRLPLVEDGVLRHILYDDTEAWRSGRPGQRSTGHGQGAASSTPAVGAACVSLAAGDQPWSALCAAQRAVLVPRFAGTVDPTSGDFSGVVKGGALLIDGEAHPIAEVSVAGNLYAALKAISGISAERSLLMGTSLLPGLRVEDVSITAG